MRISDLGRYALGVCVAAILAGCGGGSSAPLSPSPAGVAAERTHVRPTYSVIYSFAGGYDDGAEPVAGLINVDGMLYGTTASGGKYYKCYDTKRIGCGTVFSITTSGKETVLHSFGDGSGDGKDPWAGLLNVNGTLYGTTQWGGAYGGSFGDGTVFSITKSGKETVVYSFGEKSGDGTFPHAGLLNVNGTLYSTTIEGGATGNGTVFSIATSGGETVLHSFSGGRDGKIPEAAPVNVSGMLYGTTQGLGKGKYCCGTVFAIAPSGNEKVLHSFGHGSGKYPDAGLLNVNGTLYGTTSYGGAYHWGTVFAITTSGKLTVLHNFSSASGDGIGPAAGLINVNGTLYGTTEFGGASDDGTVFSITTSGKETVLYSFGGSGDGTYPVAALLNVNGTLYGTTLEGGATGNGTVFAFSRLQP